MRRSFLVIIPVLLVAAACGGSGPSGTAASFNGTKISNAAFTRELNALKGNKKLAEVAKQGGFDISTNGKLDPRLAAGWLAADVQQVPVEQEFKRRKLTISPEARTLATQHTAQQLVGAQSDQGMAVLDAFPKWFRDLMVEHQAQVEVLADAFAKDDGFADDRAWLAANATTVSQACPSGKVVRHVLVKTKDEADAVEAQIAGGADFSAVAAEKSTDTGSKTQGGVVGCLADGQFVAPFEAAANALAPGQVSPPVQTEFGFHVIRVDVPSVDATPQFISQLRGQAGQQRFAKWIDEQMNAAKITVDPRWGTPDLQNGQFQIIPPTTTTTRPASTGSTGPTPSTAPPLPPASESVSTSAPR